MKLIATGIQRDTEISDTYRRCAAWQSMEAYLLDWKAARDRLDRQIGEMDRMLGQRRAAEQAGEWPPHPEHAWDCDVLNGDGIFCSPHCPRSHLATPYTEQETTK